MSRPWEPGTGSHRGHGDVTPGFVPVFVHGPWGDLRWSRGRILVPRVLPSLPLSRQTFLRPKFVVPPGHRGVLLQTDSHRREQGWTGVFRSGIQEPHRNLPETSGTLDTVGATQYFVPSTKQLINVSQPGRLLTRLSSPTVSGPAPRLHSSAEGDRQEDFSRRTVPDSLRTCKIRGRGVSVNPKGI